MPPTIEQFIDTDLRPGGRRRERGMEVMRTEKWKMDFARILKRLLAGVDETFLAIADPEEDLFAYPQEMIDTLEYFKYIGIPCSLSRFADTKNGKRIFTCSHIHFDLENAGGKYKDGKYEDLNEGTVVLGVSVKEKVFKELFPNNRRKISIEREENEENWSPYNGNIQQFGDHMVLSLDITKTEFAEYLVRRSRIQEAVNKAIDRNKNNRPTDLWE